jgi:transcriptional regulator with XRE-family HTH domain
VFNNPKDNVMHQTILTNKQAKQARSSLRLSQGSVAGALDMSRTYLSQFENGHYLLEDTTLNQLRDFYGEQGYDFENTDASPDIESPPERNTSTRSVHHRIIDGFVIPNEAEEDNVDAALSEYADNTRKIWGLCKAPIKDGFFGIDEEARDAATRKTLLLMARNFAIIEQLHGHQSIYPKQSKQQNNIGDYIAQLFSSK